MVANHVVLMDLWWNPTTEEQAIDRAHRIGVWGSVGAGRVCVGGAFVGACVRSCLRACVRRRWLDVLGRGCCRSGCPPWCLPPIAAGVGGGVGGSLGRPAAGDAHGPCGYYPGGHLA